MDPIESKVAEIGQSVAAVCQYVENEQMKKAEKERRKAERLEAQERAEAEQLAQEMKRKKKVEKKLKKAKFVEEMNKNVDVQVAVRFGELREDVREDVRAEIRQVISELSCTAASQGKQKVCEETCNSGTGSSSGGSGTEELSARTRNLYISEKRKRGPEPVFENSPPMELPPKRTPKKSVVKPAKLTARMTRARAKCITPKKATPRSGTKKKTPAAIGPVGRLKYERQMLQELKNLDALVLQNMCKDEGVPYNGKFEAIFNIAAHCTRMAYGTEEDEAETSHEVEAVEAEEIAEKADAE
ncbi:hypothetical protein CBR_g24376 [Chara braunii]|uniref:Uncharacterized protein n=1 Tax=Chara braunii TaxID=69332 RepID=A0A388JMI3_CHABU|nr:hypothetical protein CBR_g24376 [Chara braunii]|eukprot:GBG59029.1 hypothetical protein CBR_g24376 [Chara braunii]